MTIHQGKGLTGEGIIKIGKEEIEKSGVIIVGDGKVIKRGWEIELITQILITKARENRTSQDRWTRGDMAIVKTWT